jgi:beta-lactam-binding protein with PASTA domain/tRNA A-37 threonylcarbamoyl transferase component Bud32
VNGYPPCVVMSRMADQIGRVLSGRYRLIAPIGTGASAQVYLADDVRLRRRVAVKVLHAALAEDDAFLRRFRAEAQAAAALNHPHIVAVYDWGEDDGAPYIVTEYLGGGSLRALLDRGVRLSPSQALAVGLETTRALDYAHRRGFVHRDIKPANLLFGEDGRLRIADFGLARALAEAAWTEPQGAVLGTARYSSPEQAQGQAVDGKADVYSLGLLLIECVTGTVPFTADTTIATLMARVGKPVEVPEALGPLRRALERAGSPEPADRPDAGELGIALMAAAEQLPRPDPLPLASGVAPDPDDGGDATMLGTALVGTRVAAGDEPTVALDTADGGEPTSAAAAPPDWLDDDLVVVTDDEERRKRRWPWAVLVAVLAVLVGGGAAFAYSEMSTPSHTIPNLEGMTEAEARAEADALGFDVATEESREDGSTPGEVLSTRPAAGEELDEGDTLTLVISLGNTLAPVPTDLAGKTLAEATQVLTDAGGFTPEVTRRASEEIPLDVVIGVAGGVPAELPKGAAVPLVVSSGPAPRTVPSGLVGGTFEEAQAALAGVQLRAKQVDEFSDTVEKGRVIRVEPGEGEQAPRDSEVSVVVSRGPDLVTIPDVGGMSLEEAVAAIEGAGLTVGDAFGPANGRPFATDPEAGTQVKRGATVDIYLRR